MKSLNNPVCFQTTYRHKTGSAPFRISEDKEQIAIASWLDRHVGKYGWIHVANERRTSPRQGAILKAKGQKKGFPDILIFTNANSNIKGIVIELKRRDGKSKPTQEQTRWLEELTKKGYVCNVCYGCQEAIRWLQSSAVSFCLPLTTPTPSKREKTAIAACLDDQPGKG